MSIKKAYQYFYYQMYRLMRSSLESWWMEGRAYVVLLIFEFLFLFSFVVYYGALVDTSFQLPTGDLWVYVVAGVMGIFNYIVFLYNDRWKQIVEEFDKLPKRTNKIGGWIVFGIVVLIIANIVFAFYLLSKVGVNRVS